MAGTNRYALADYIITLNFPSSVASGIGGNQKGSRTILPIGGPGENGYEGSYLDNITVARAADTWTTTGDPTGSWVHELNLDRTGTISLTLKQVSDATIKLAYLTNSYFDANIDTENVEPLFIQVRNAYTNTVIAEGYDSYVKKMPDFQVGGTTGSNEWVFTCGRVMIYNDLENPYSNDFEFGGEGGTLI